MTTKSVGDHFESLACDFLQAKGLTFITKNVFTRYGEIDLIMKDHSCLVFIEVRYRKNDLYGKAEATVNYNKQQNIIRSSFIWMEGQNINCEMQEYRYDVFAFTGSSYNWITNAFELSV